MRSGCRCRIRTSKREWAELTSFRLDGMAYSMHRQWQRRDDYQCVDAIGCWSRRSSKLGLRMDGIVRYERRFRVERAVIDGWVRGRVHRKLRAH